MAGETHLEIAHVFLCALEGLRTHSVCLFGFFGILGGIVGADVGEPDALLLCVLLIAYFTFHVEADHHLVDHHANDGAQEWGKNGHQEPALSNPERWSNESVEQS